MNREIYILPKFTYIPNEIIEKIKNPDALGLYVFLESHHFDVSLKFLQNHFNCDPLHIIKHFDYLKAAGLVEGDLE